MTAEPRVPLLPPDAAHAAAESAGVVAAAADLSVFRVWLHQPQMAGWLHDLIMGLLWKGNLDTKLRELVIMRLGLATGSDYEWTQHWRIATEFLGLDPEDLLAAREWRSSARFAPAERAILAATDDIVEWGAISDAAWKECVQHVGAEPALLVEMTGVIAVWHMVSVILRSLAVPLEDGVASWPPDGTAPT